MHRLGLLVVLVGTPGRLPVIVPPARTDLGVPLGGIRGLRITTGAHSAGLTRSDGPTLDVGAGWVAELPPEGGTGAQGGYVEVGVLGPRAPGRISAAVRGEATGESAERLAPTARVRLGLELNVDGSSGATGRCGGGATGGDAGLGVYVDVGRAWAVDDEASWVATVGLSGRTPAFIGYVLLMPGC